MRTDPQMTQIRLDLRKGETTVGHVLDRIRLESRDESEKGRWFENLVGRVLLDNPEYEIEEVHRWADWPDRRAETGLDGRDIGSVVVPDAEVKIFVTADLETRAERRRLEIAAQGLPADSAAVLDAIRARDQRDEGRPVAPLRRAPGAHLLDTTDLGIEEAVDKVAAIIAEHVK